MSAYTGVWVIIFIRCHTLVRYAIVWQGLNHFHSRMIKTVAWLTYPTTARHQWESMAAWYTQFPTLETTFKFYMKLRNWIYYWCVSWSLSSIYIYLEQELRHTPCQDGGNWRSYWTSVPVPFYCFVGAVNTKLTSLFDSRSRSRYIQSSLVPVMSVNCGSVDEILTTNHRTLSSSHFQWCKINLHVK
jgi:hypothetical protein